MAVWDDVEIKKDYEQEIQKPQNTNIGIFWNTLDYINRLEERVEFLKIELSNCEFLKKELEIDKKNLEAENERLKNAYEQCAWERDIFAEDMKEEIKKDCSYLMLDIKTIKAEAYKEFWEELKRRNTMDKRIVSVATGDNLVKELAGEK